VLSDDDDVDDDDNNNNNRISTPPYSRNFRGAGGRLVGSVFSKSLIEQKSFESGFKKQTENH